MGPVIRWLLEGDISLQYLTHSLLLGSDLDILEPLQARIETEGYGARFLSCRGENGHWGRWFYQPKWTCTHYTLADLKNIGMPCYSHDCREMVKRAFDECMLASGGINFSKTMLQSDVCVDGMVLDYASYFCPADERVPLLAEFILSQSKPDGGYSWDPDGLKSDAHTTICVLEGFHAYKRAGFSRHLEEIELSEKRAVEYILSNGLFMSDDKRYVKLSYPYRYRYDVLRVLEYFAAEKISYDERMEPALEWLSRKQNAVGSWNLENLHPGNIHFELEDRRKPSRFITLKALTIQKYFFTTKGEGRSDLS